MNYLWVIFFGIALFLVIIKLVRKSKGFYRHLQTILLALAALFITISVVMFPEDAFEASLQGLDMWWNIVFPALLPFFILAQLLIGLGVVHMMGVFLEPVMRPIFNVPGVGSFVLAMGLSSGFPLGAILTADMRRKQMISKIEAERLVSFVNTADPLFMFGAVAVGMFGYPEIGVPLALAHYLSTLTVGLMMRFYGNDPTPTYEGHKRGRLAWRAITTLIEARRQDGRMIGQLLGDAIRKSVDTQILIGGFIILFSVIIRILDVISIAGILSTAIAYIILPFGLDPALAPGLVHGLFEIDLGCQVVGSPDTFTALNQKIIAASIIIAWSGISVHAQVASIVSDTDINIKPYIIARLFHAVLAGFIAALIVGPAEPLLGYIDVPVFYSSVPTGSFSFWWERTYFILRHLSILVGGATVISIMVHYGKRLSIIAIRARR